MEVIKAKSAGFCFGVKKAMETVYQQIEENANRIQELTEEKEQKNKRKESLKQNKAKFEKELNEREDELRKITITHFS